MASFHVVAIKVRNSGDELEDITHIAYALPFGDSNVLITLQEAIDRITNNPYEFYVRRIKNPIFLELSKKKSEDIIHLKSSVGIRRRDILLSLRKVS